MRSAESGEWRVESKLTVLVRRNISVGRVRIWRRFADDQPENLMLITIETRRQSRIETRGTRYTDLLDQPPRRPAGTPRDENSGARSETGPSGLWQLFSRQAPRRPAGTPRDENRRGSVGDRPERLSYFQSRHRAGLPAPPGMKTAGLGRRPARAVMAAIFKTGAAPACPAPLGMKMAVAGA